MSKTLNMVGGGGSGLYASIFATGVSQSDTVTLTTPSGKVKSGKWATKEKRIPYAIPAMTSNTTPSGKVSVSSSAVDSTYPVEVEGFLFDKLNEFGTYTLTASNGEKTVSETVLVDVVSEYRIEIEYNKLYLYKNGDECEDVTGGFTGCYVTASRNTITMLDDHTHHSANYTNDGAFLKTNNPIDLTNYSKLYVEADVESGSTSDAEIIFGTTIESHTNVYWSGVYPWKNRYQNGAIGSSGAEKAIYSCELTDKTGTYIFAGISQGIGNMYRIWLE